MFNEGEEMIGDDTFSALRYFLIEYKKRLPDTEENKDFHEHIDFMIKYFKNSELWYRTDWEDYISSKDERYWRHPNELELKEISDKRTTINKKDGILDGVFRFIDRVIK
jgi:hypothetical protein